MTHPLDGVRAKLDRADQHLDELKTGVAAFNASDPYKVAQNFDFPSGIFTLNIVHIEQPPIEWGTIIGDVIANLRSALDHLAWQLGSLSGVEPHPKTEFPIFKEPAEYADARAQQKIVSLSPTDRALIDGLQPYQRTNNVDDDPLWMLHELSNVDKHRTLHSVSLVHEKGGVAINELYGFEMKESFFAGHEEGAEIFRCGLVRTGGPASLQVNPQFVSEIAFRGGRPSSDGKPLIDTLHTIRKFVHENVVAEFEPSFGQGAQNPTSDRAAEIPPSRG